MDKGARSIDEDAEEEQDRIIDYGRFHERHLCYVHGEMILPGM